MNKYSSTSQVDSTILMRQLVSLGLFLLTVVAAAYVITTGNKIYMLGLVALPFVLMMMQAPTGMLLMALILNATMLPVPGLKASQLGLMAELLFVGTFFLGILIGKLAWKPEKTAEGSFVKWYAAIVIIIIVARGTGLRALGSETWGGTRYIYQLAAIGMFFALSGFRLNNKAMRWIMWGSLVAGIVGGLIMWKTGDRFSESTNEINQGRLSFVRPVYLSLLPIAIAMRYRNFRWINVGLVLLSLGLVGLTGFRSFLVGATVTVAGYGFFKSRNKVVFTTWCMLLGLLSWGLIIAVSSSLPIGMQRAVSFIPGVQVDADIMYNASHSVNWRIEIWRYCLEQSHQYLWLGRGLTFNVLDVLRSSSMDDISVQTTWFMYEMHSYHSGPLTMLIDFGIPGLIIHLLFTIYAFKRVWGYSCQLAKLDTIESRYALFMCVVLLWDLISFYLVYGSSDRIALEIIGLALVTVYTKSILKDRDKDPGELV